MVFSSLENCITEVEKSLVYFKHHINAFLWEKVMNPAWIIIRPPTWLCTCRPLISCNSWLCYINVTEHQLNILLKIIFSKFWWEICPSEIALRQQHFKVNEDYTWINAKTHVNHAILSVALKHDLKTYKNLQH